MTNTETELLRLLPPVLRARDFFLYLEGGKRLTDLWLSGGKAILGHKPAKVLRELKNSAERGLFAAFPHPLEKRFFKSMGELFPGKAFRLYTDRASLFWALEESGEKEVQLWRPFLEGQNNEAHVLLPVLPWPLGPEVLVLEKNHDAFFPAGDLISPVLLAPAARALYDLIKIINEPKWPKYSKIEKALAESPWQRRGIYLTVDQNMEREKYKALFLSFLEGGFLIPSSPAEPVILPPSMSPGEESKLAELISLSCQ